MSRIPAVDRNCRENAPRGVREKKIEHSSQSNVSSTMYVFWTCYKNNRMCFFDRWSHHVNARSIPRKLLSNAAKLSGNLTLERNSGSKDISKHQQINGHFQTIFNVESWLVRWVGVVSNCFFPGQFVFQDKFFFSEGCVFFIFFRKIFFRKIDFVWFKKRILIIFCPIPPKYQISN